MHSRNTLLFSNEEPWVKNDCDENFDVPMGCYDGVEICELTGTSYYIKQMLFQKKTLDCKETKDKDYLKTCLVQR